MKAEFEPTEDGEKEKRRKTEEMKAKFAPVIRCIEKLQGDTVAESIVRDRRCDLSGSSKDEGERCGLSANVERVMDDALKLADASLLTLLLTGMVRRGDDNLGKLMKDGIPLLSDECVRTRSVMHARTVVACDYFTVQGKRRARARSLREKLWERTRLLLMVKFEPVPTSGYTVGRINDPPSTRYVLVRCLDDIRQAACKCLLSVRGGQSSGESWRIGKVFSSLFAKAKRSFKPGGFDTASFGVCLFV